MADIYAEYVHPLVSLVHFVVELYAVSDCNSYLDMELASSFKIFIVFKVTAHTGNSVNYTFHAFLYIR